jgi:hypothetical protein
MLFSTRVGVSLHPPKQSLDGVLRWRRQCLGSLAVMCHSNYESVTFWATLVGTVVAAASAVISIVALLVARSSLSLAKMVAEQEQRDWKQRKWFDLYFAASEAYDVFEHFQTQYKSTDSEEEYGMDLNNLMFLFRKVGAMAVVFPKGSPIGELVSSFAVFKDRNEAFSRERLKTVFDAVEGLREKAWIYPTVLECGRMKL